MFHTENARLLPESAVFALWKYVSPVVGGQVGHGKANLISGGVRMLCRNASYVLPCMACVAP